MRRFLVCLLVMLGVCLPLGLAVPQLRIEPPAKKISTDQSVTLKLQLEWPQAEGPYEINALEPMLENLMLKDQNQSQETGETVSQTLLFIFQPVKPGVAVIYPFEISYRKIETDPWIPILVPEQKINVVASFPAKAILVELGFAAALGAAGYFSYKYFQIFKAREAAKNVPPPDPKQRIYAKAEESIANFSSPNAKEKLVHWSNQLRTVIVAYYDVTSKSATNTEILSFLKAKELPMGEWNEVSGLFAQLTEMQFSRQDIPAYDLDRMQKTLLQYVKGKIIIGNSNF